MILPTWKFSFPERDHPYPPGTMNLDFISADGDSAHYWLHSSLSTDAIIKNVHQIERLLNESGIRPCKTNAVVNGRIHANVTIEAKS